MKRTVDLKKLEKWKKDYEIATGKKALAYLMNETGFSISTLEKLFRGQTISEPGCRLISRLLDFKLDELFPFDDSEEVA
ncbi:MAG: hypothetical protein Unbinned5081contig1003_23 [Prokaryotic dsDNA virus sp.]|nr:MAG: hypothetical protein Unbinned5081contig1003_23 [Prokaryotic dsDNA virus sp.]|tara:strand:- start:4303 stop:4539 length:237 start_codon:yes stop_codon:yes gene_type:complete